MILVNKVTDHPCLSTTVLILALRALLPWKPLNTENTRSVSHLTQMYGCTQQLGFGHTQMKLAMVAHKSC